MEPLTKGFQIPSLSDSKVFLLKRGLRQISQSELTNQPRWHYQASPLLRAGVIGTGFIGPVRLEALRRLGVTVAAICDVADVGAKAAAKLGIPQAFADYRPLLASPEVDAVHISTPNRFHVG